MPFHGVEMKRYLKILLPLFLFLTGLPPQADAMEGAFYLTSPEGARSGAMAGAHWLAVAVIVGSTLLNAGYYLPIVHRAFFRKSDEGNEAPAHGEAPWPMVLALVLTAGMTIVLLFLSDPLLQFVKPLVAIGS